MTTEREPGRYRRRPVEVEAIRYLPGEGCNCYAVADFCRVDAEEAVGHEEGGECEELEWFLDSPDGMESADPGDWIVKDPEGGLWSFPTEVFEKAYEET